MQRILFIFITNTITSLSSKVQYIHTNVNGSDEYGSPELPVCSLYRFPSLLVLKIYSVTLPLVTMPRISYSDRRSTCRYCFWKDTTVRCHTSLRSWRSWRASVGEEQACSSPTLARQDRQLRRLLSH
jgi:hypothetical protein